MMTQINIWGNPFGNTGYNIHTANLALALAKKTDVSIDAQPILEDNSLNELCKKPIHNNSAMIMITLPYQWQLRYAERFSPLIGFGVWEGDKIHSSFVEQCNDVRLQEIWVPSDHTREAFENSGVDNNIEIIPHGVNTDIYKTKPVPDDLKNDNFNFLFVGGWKDGVNDRKGLDILLRAYTEEFKKNEKVLLTCKLNMAYQDKDNVISNIKMLNLKSPELRAQIGLILTNVPESILADYYNAADCFVMPSKAEAFCLPVAESMACSCTPIVTNYGGQTDYVNDKNGLLIDIDGMAPATGGVLYEETKWSIPSQKHLQEQLRYAFDNQSEMKKKGKRAKKTIADNYTWDKTAERVVDRLETLQTS